MYIRIKIGIYACYFIKPLKLLCPCLWKAADFIVIACCIAAEWPDLQFMCPDTILVSGQPSQGKGPSQDPRSWAFPPRGCRFWPLLRLLPLALVLPLLGIALWLLDALLLARIGVLSIISGLGYIAAG